MVSSRTPVFLPYLKKKTPGWRGLSGYLSVDFRSGCVRRFRDVVHLVELEIRGVRTLAKELQQVTLSMSAASQKIVQDA